MEPLFFLLVGGLLFTQGWHLLGLYADSRTVGLIAGALALGLVMTAVAGPLIQPLLINPTTTPVLIAVRGFVLLWAVYAAALSAHGLWGFEPRALGFYVLLLWMVSLAVLGLPWAYAKEEISNDALLVLDISALVLAIVSAMVFFHLAVPFRRMRAVTAWCLLAGSTIVVALGLTVFFGVFETVSGA